MRWLIRRNARVGIKAQQCIAFLLIISIHEILSTSALTVLKFNYSDSFVLTTTLIYTVQVAKSINTTLTSNSYHSKYVWFIWLLIQFHKFRKILIILINVSSGSKYSSTFTVLVVVAFTKEEERKRQRQQAKETPNPLVSDYYKWWVMESRNHDEYFMYECV